MATVDKTVLASSQDSQDQRLPSVWDYYWWDSRRLLGRGSFGTVYLAHMRNERIVHALKFVNEQLGPNWQQEFHLLCHVQHPHVVHVALDVLA